MTPGRRRLHTCLDVSRAVCFDFPSCSASLFLPLCFAATIQTKIKKFEASAQTETDANICHIIFPRLTRKHRTHAECLHAHAFHLPRNCVTFSLRSFFLFARHRKKVDANVDLLPLCCACFATAACLLLMSVNTFSESALGILKEQST